MITKNFRAKLTSNIGWANISVTDIWGNSRTLPGYKNSTSSSGMTLFVNSGSVNYDDLPQDTIIPTKIIKRMPRSLSDVSTAVNVISNSLFIAVGSGTTAPTENDYYLENPITLGILNASYTTIRDADNKIIGGKIIFTINNNTSDNVTINEIGVIAGYGTSYTSANPSSIYPFLIDRTVLESGITLAPSEQANVSVSFTVPI